MAALAGLHVLLADLVWWFAGSFFSAVVLTVSSFLRGRIRRAFWPPLLALVAGFLVLSAVHVPASMFVLVVPTLDTFPALWGLASEGITSIIVQAVPATPDPGIVFLLSILMIVAAWFAEVFLNAHTPALVALPVGVIAVVPLAVASGLADPVWFVVTAVLYLMLLRRGRRQDSRRMIALVAAAVMVLSFVVPLALPSVTPAPGAPGNFGFRVGVNPLLSLGDDLRRGAPVSVARYVSDSGGPLYLRLSTMQDFTSDRWTSSVSPDTQRGALDAFPDPEGLSDDVLREAASVDIEVTQLTSRWLPMPYPASRVEGVEGDFGWELPAYAVRSSQSSANKQDYTVEFWDVAPTAEQLRASSPLTAREAPEGTLVLPELTARISETAVAATAGAGNPFDQAMALQTFLRSSPFRYSEEAPVEQGFDGDGIAAIDEFLRVQAGYCVHYASAMAVMARAIGIPSRVAVGFQPGTRQTVDGASVYELTTDDLHAWPELYFEGVGWVQFEPTPGRGSTPSFSETPVDDPATPQDESTIEPTAAPAPTTTVRPDVPLGDDGVVTRPEAQLETTSWIGLLVVAGLLLLFATPALFRAFVRAGRYRRIRRARGSGSDAASAAWEELRDTARDHGWAAPDSETPRGFADRLLRAVPDVDGAVGVFRASVESAAYARPGHRVAVHEVQAARHAIAEAAELRTRLLAVVLPASLAARWRLEPPVSTSTTDDLARQRSG